MGSILKLDLNTRALVVAIKYLAPLAGISFMGIDFAYLD